MNEHAARLQDTLEYEKAKVSRTAPRTCFDTTKPGSVNAAKVK